MQSAVEVFGPDIGSKKYRVIYADPPWAFIEPASVFLNQAA
jgi:hypothetical protein